MPNGRKPAQVRQFLLRRDRQERELLLAQGNHYTAPICPKLHETLLRPESGDVLILFNEIGWAKLGMPLGLAAASQLLPKSRGGVEWQGTCRWLPVGGVRDIR